MNRKMIYDAVNAVCPTYWVGQHQGECLTKYAVIKYNFQNKSTNNQGAGWQYLQIMLYTPKSSVAGIESALDSIRTALINIGLEPSGNQTPDYIDTEKNAIMRAEKYRIPKEIYN